MSALVSYYIPIKDIRLVFDILHTKTYNAIMNGMNALVRAATRKAMKNQGVSQNMMAVKLDSNQPNIARLLSGRSGRIPESWQKMFDVLGLELIVVPKEKVEFIERILLDET